MALGNISPFDTRTPILDKEHNNISFPHTRWFQTVGNAINTPLNISEPPVHSGAPGTIGQVAQDGNFVYVCTAKNTWKRSALVPF